METKQALKRLKKRFSQIDSQGVKELVLAKGVSAYCTEQVPFGSRFVKPKENVSREPVISPKLQDLTPMIIGRLELNTREEEND